MPLSFHWADPVIHHAILVYATLFCACRFCGSCTIAGHVTVASVIAGVAKEAAIASDIAEAAKEAAKEVAKEVGAKHVTAVAIAYVMHKAPYVFPLIGARKVEQLEANVEALEIVLSPEHIKYLESIVPFELGFPFGLIVSLTRVWFRQLCLTFCFLQGDGSEYNFLMQNAAYMEKHPGPRPIVPDNS